VPAALVPPHPYRRNSVAAVRPWNAVSESEIVVPVAVGVPTSVVNPSTPERKANEAGPVPDRWPVYWREAKLISKSKLGVMVYVK
jgi:hypothetical protein